MYFTVPSHCDSTTAVYETLKIILCQASSLPPEGISFSDKVFGDELDVITHSTLSLDVSLRALTRGLVISSVVLTGRGPLRQRKGTLFSMSQENVIYIYLNKEGDDVNKLILLWTSFFFFSCPHILLFIPSTPNLGCKCLFHCIVCGFGFH